MDYKPLKKAARQTVKKHYLLLILICFLALFIYSLPSIIPTGNGYFYAECINHIRALFGSNETLYFTRTELLQEIGQSNLNMSPIAFIFYLLFVLGKLCGGILQQSIPMGICFMIFPVIVLALFIFVFQTMAVILRRVYLELRTYDHVPAQHFLFLSKAKKWKSASIAYLTYLIYQFLWDLTIVGGIIKHYSYYCVPFILAENPGLSGRDAINLSRQMMNGHKMEAFLLDLSMIGWYLLNIVTFGYSGVFYSNAYMLGVETEYYVTVRALAIQNAIAGSEALNDIYLYEKAAPEVLAEAYKSIKMDEMYIADTEVPLKGAQKFFAETFSLWFGKAKQRKIYQGVENLKCQLINDKEAVNNVQYPARLAPWYSKDMVHFDGNMNPSRIYPYSSLFLLFIAGSLVAWLFQNPGFISTTGIIVKNGFLHGPWMAMFGAAGIITLLVLSKLRKKPAASYLWSVLIFGVIAYLTEAVLLQIFGAFWFDESSQLFNFSYFVSVQLALSFAAIYMAIIYVIGPAFDQWLSRKNQKAVLIITLILLVVFMVDVIFSFMYPNMHSSYTFKYLPSFFNLL